MQPRALAAALVLSALGSVGSPGHGIAEPSPLFFRAYAAAEGKGAAPDLLAEKRGKLGEGAALELSVSLGPRQCVVVAGAAEGSLSDLELSLRPPEGLTLTDGGSGPQGAMRYCAGRAQEQVTVRAKADGTAEALLGVWGVRRAGPPPAAAPVRGKPAPATPEEPAEPGPLTLEQRLAQLATKIGAEMSAVTPPRREKMTPGTPLSRDVPLELEHCYRVLAVTEPPATNVDLALVDAKGAGLVSEKGGDLDVVLPEDVTFCPKESGVHGLKLKLEGSASEVLWQVFGAARAPASPWPAGGEGNTFLSKRMRQMQAQAGAAGAAMPYQAFELSTATARDELLEVQAGTCYVAFAVGVPSLRVAELELIDQRGHVVARSEQQSSTASARACADVNARWTVRVRAFKGYGEVGVQAFRAGK